MLPILIFFDDPLFAAAYPNGYTPPEQVPARYQLTVEQDSVLEQSLIDAATQLRALAAANRRPPRSDLRDADERSASWGDAMGSTWGTAAFELERSLEPVAAALAAEIYRRAAAGARHPATARGEALMQMHARDEALRLKAFVGRQASLLN